MGVKEFHGYVRRIDFEPKMDFLDFRTYAHVFLVGEGGALDVYHYCVTPDRVLIGCGGNLDHFDPLDDSSTEKLRG